jgi:hypothetical protein
MAANRALIKAARGLITCQTTKQAGEMIHIILYEEECKGLGGPRRYLHEARALSRDLSRARR